MQVSVGEVFRDTYYDGKAADKTQRTIKIVEVAAHRVRAETLTNCMGVKLSKPRITNMKIESLRTGYEPVA